MSQATSGRTHPRTRKGALFLCALALAGSATLPSLAQDAEPAKKTDMAILIVGDDTNPVMHEREKALIGEMARTLKNKARLPILSYHFNKPRERTYCEKKLNVISEDLLFVGVVSLVDRVPKKVLYRLDRIVSPARAANDVVGRSEDMMGMPPSETTSITPTAAPPEAPVTPMAPEAPPAPPQKMMATTGSGHWRVQLGVFSAMKNAQEVVDQLKAKGFEGKVDKAEDKIKVYVGPYASKEEAQSSSAALHKDGFEKSFVVEVK